MPAKSPIETNEDFRRAFLAEEREWRVRTGQLACVLVILLMPFGALLDYCYFGPPNQYQFVVLRLWSMVVMVGVWFLQRTKIARERYPMWIGLPIVWVPSAFIAWMIYKTEGWDSPYYAGLNLIVLGVSALGQWSVRLSAVAVGGVLVMYSGGCLLQGGALRMTGVSFNNLYFISLTSVIVLTGNHIFNRLRFREFVSRYELNERKRELEEAIRKLREAEAQLVQQEKMASLGVMSAGIIHEINNPLNFAATGLFTLRKKGKQLPPEQLSDYQEVLTDIEDGLNRVKSIVSDLRLFTHPDTGSLDDVELEEVVTSALRFLANELNDNVKLERTLPPGLTVRANKHKLIHVLTNLLQNSLDAFRRKAFNGEHPTIWIEGRAAPDRVFLTVRDNGPGIAPENQQKIFDPFYTTKEVGEGMGLGLSICYRLMQEFNGEIKLDSEPNRYCQFTLEFPTRATPKPAA